MKKIMDFAKINETCDTIQEKCLELRNKESEMIKCISSLKEINSTDNIDRIVLLYAEKIKKLEDTVGIIEFYLKVMRDSSNVNEELFQEFEGKLKNNLEESEKMRYEKY